MSTNNTTTVRSLDRVKEWELNPRRGTFRGIEALCESIRTVGLQDAIHVWERTDGDYLLKGHRRLRAMREIGLTECAQVVHRFESEEEAFLFLLQDHGHTDALDNEEKITAVENAVSLGLTAAEIAPALGVTEERVQLWFDLGHELPMAARSALGKGTLSMNVAELLLTVDKEERVSATQLVLHDPATNEPMSPAVAKASIEARYLLPKKWEREWLALSAKLKKKERRIADGFQYVEFQDRLQFLQGNSGQPWAEYEYGDGFIPGDRHGRRWMEQAAELGVPVFVVAAPTHVDGHVLLVSRRMLRDAEAAKGGNDETRMRNEEGAGKDKETERLADGETEADRSVRGPVDEAAGAGDADAWEVAADWSPSGANHVLATDGEGHFVAYFEADEWRCAVTEEPFDSVITHWRELPGLPGEGNDKGVPHRPAN